MEYWRDIRFEDSTLHYSKTRSLGAIFVGGFNIRLSNAEVASTAPKIANDRP